MSSRVWSGTTGSPEPSVTLGQQDRKAIISRLLMQMAASHQVPQLELADRSALNKRRDADLSQWSKCTSHFPFSMKTSTCWPT